MLLVTVTTLDPSRMMGGTLSHDTCSMTQLTSDNLSNLLLGKGKEKCLSEDELKIYQGY